MKFSILVILLVWSTISLCLAKPRWVWKNEEEEKQLDERGNLNSDVMEGESLKDYRNLVKKWIESHQKKCPEGLSTYSC